jgi:hypothetical protein
LRSETAKNTTEEKMENNNTTTMFKKSASRLVLGEQAAAAEEARTHGGAFIEIHPGVLQTLQRGHIDPYVIYQQSLIQQIDDHIPRIDFVGSNVDELIQRWNGKSPDETPIHVRLAQWLKDHAKEYHYEQNGNSWILK